MAAANIRTRLVDHVVAVVKVSPPPAPPLLPLSFPVDLVELNLRDILVEYLIRAQMEVDVDIDADVNNEDEGVFEVYS